MFAIYLDACCLNRPFDDQTQPRIHLESEAVLLILTRIEEDDWQGIRSDALDFEIAQMPDSDRRKRVERIQQSFQHRVHIGREETKRAQELEVLGFHPLDALHLACAESGTADIFLTTDDRLQRLAARVIAKLSVRAANPLTWLHEVT